MTGEEIVARARACIGARFRPQGRDPAHGLDCIGVAMMAMDLPRARAPRYYNLRSSDPALVNREFSACGFLRVVPKMARVGDLLVTEVEGRQLHIVLLTPKGYLHADVRHRRVVEVPGPLPWPIVSAWRHPEATPEPRVFDRTGDFLPPATSD
ncbi:MAG: peptidoglycan endopeptidase [Sphingomonadaceae bacterium]